MSIPGYSIRQLPTKSAEQMDLSRLLLGGTRPGLAAALSDYAGMAGGGDDYFRALEAPAQRQFQRNIDQLANRFSGLGMGAQDSSGFQAAVAGAGREMAENLGLQRLQLQENARRQLLSLASELLGMNTFENIAVPKRRSGGQDFIASLSGGLGRGTGFLGSLKTAKMLGLI